MHNALTVFIHAPSAGRTFSDIEFELIRLLDYRNIFLLNCVPEVDFSIFFELSAVENRSFII